MRALASILFLVLLGSAVAGCGRAGPPVRSLPPAPAAEPAEPEEDDEEKQS